MKLRLTTIMAILPIVAAAGSETSEHVILLHGLCRTSRSMIPMEQALTKAGYKVLNVNYPSRTGSIERLSEDAIGTALKECQGDSAVRIHFVTHSLGGILVCSYLSRHEITNLGRVVMLSPPNQGSEVVDKLERFWLFRKVNGPAGSELRTDGNSTPDKLGPADFSLGVVAGNRSINWINSLLIPGSDDGKVSVERTKLRGMSDHIVIHVTHPFIMRNKAVIQQTIHFLRDGRFDHQS